MTLDDLNPIGNKPFVRHKAGLTPTVAELKVRTDNDRVGELPERKSIDFGLTPCMNADA